MRKVKRVMSDEPQLPIAVFLSGGGRSLANLIEHRDTHDLPIDIRLVVSSSSKVRGVKIARDAGLTTIIVRKSDHPEPHDYSEAMFAALPRSRCRVGRDGGLFKACLDSAKISSAA